MRRSKTLEQLDGEDWGKPPFDSRVVRESHRLRKVPISKFDNENLRFLIGQQMSLDVVIPIALEQLEGNILASGKLYAGDLLMAVVSIDGTFWSENPKLAQRLSDVLIEVELVSETLNEVSETFRAQTSAGTT